MFTCDHTTHVPPGARCQACPESRQATVKRFDRGRWCDCDSHIHDGSAVVRNRRFAVVIINEFVHATRSKRRLYYVNDCHAGPNVAETARTSQYTRERSNPRRAQEAPRTFGPCLATCPCPRAIGQSEQERRTHKLLIADHVAESLKHCTHLWSDPAWRHHPPPLWKEL